MVLVNFSHPMENSQIARIEGMIEYKIDKVVSTPAQFDLGKSLKPQVEQMIRDTGLSWQEWADTVCLYPSLNFAAIIFAGIMNEELGFIPPMVRTAPVAGGFTRKFEVVEIVYRKSP